VALRQREGISWPRNKLHPSFLDQAHLPFIVDAVFIEKGCVRLCVWFVSHSALQANFNCESKSHTEHSLLAEWSVACMVTYCHAIVTHIYRVEPCAHQLVVACVQYSGSCVLPPIVAL
jgi:hypothetical protein